MRYLFSFITAIFLVSTFSLSVVALDKVAPDIVQKAKSTIEDFSSALESQKSGYGIAENETVKGKITLGEGYKISNISDDSLNKESVKHNSEILKNSGSYAFPIKLGDRCVGIAFADDNGIFQVSSYKEFESDIEYSKNILKKELKKDDLSNDKNVNFIYDSRFGFSWLSMTTDNGEYIVPLKDDPFENLRKGLKVSSNEAANIFKKIAESRKSSRDLIGGIDGSANDITRSQLTNNSVYIYAGIIALLLVTIAGFYITKRKPINN